MHTGAAAAAQRAARGLPPEPEYYVQNDNPRLRTFRLAPGVKVYGSQQMTGSPSLTRVTVDQLRAFVRTAKGKRTAFTMRKDSAGRVTVIAEYYLP